MSAVAEAPRRVLYDLAGADPELRFSPFCWRARMALAHKDLDVATVPWRFSDRAAIAFSGQALVPVLCDGEQVVSDSSAIAQYLEDAYPDRPSLFGGPGGVALTRFVDGFSAAVIQPGVVRMIVSDIPAVLHGSDLAYFRESRERRFGRPLTAVTADRDRFVATFRASLQPLRLSLGGAPFLGGEAPLYADYLVFGNFQWARCVSDFPLLAPDDALFAWRGRMLDLFGGLARHVPHRDPTG